MLPAYLEDTDNWSDMEPSAADLAAIEAEQPVIESEVRLLDAEIAVLLVGRAKATELDWKRVRNAEADYLAAWFAYCLSLVLARKAAA